MEGKMNFVRGRRAGLGMSAAKVAEHLGMSKGNYLYKERGKVKFSDSEKIMLSQLFGWSPSEMNKYLYDGVLPLDKNAVWQDVSEMQLSSSADNDNTEGCD